MLYLCILFVVELFYAKQHPHHLKLKHHLGFFAQITNPSDGEILLEYSLVLRKKVFWVDGNTHHYATQF